VLAGISSEELDDLKNEGKNDQASCQVYADRLLVTLTKPLSPCVDRPLKYSVMPNSPCYRHCDCCLIDSGLYCLVTEAHKCKQLSK